MTVDDAVLINDACLPELVNKSGKILGFYLDMFVIVLLSESLKNGDKAVIVPRNYLTKMV